MRPRVEIASHRPASGRPATGRLLAWAACALGGLAFASPGAAQQAAPATPEAREAVADFGQCIVGRSPQKAHQTLTMDFRTREYRQALRSLADANRDCHRLRATMRAGGLPLAAAMAEALLKRPAEPLNLRLLRAAGQDAPTYAPSDRVAMCVARSDADNSAALLTAPIASPAEQQAADRLAVAVRRCTPPGVEVELRPYALRAILATASYRLLAAAPSPQERG